MNVKGRWNADDLTKSLPAALFLVAASFGLAACCRGQDSDSAKAGTAMQKRLTALCDRLESKRQESDVPGMVIVVVKDDSVILNRGFGFANVEQKTPVTDDTLFSIGSSTKAFTSALIAMLVTDGTMHWDDPITKYLPDFTLKIDSDNEHDEVTIRDLLCHRTGFWLRRESAHARIQR